MPNIRKPRSGSLQFWPRKRSKKQYANVKTWATSAEAIPLGFAGYKVGMAHIIFNDTRKTALTKGMEVSLPTTIIECPPLKTASIRFYKKTNSGSKIISEVFADKLDKELARKISIPKNVKKKIEDIKDFDDIVLLVYTQPKLTSIGKKKPELFEIALGGKKEDKLKYAKENLGKEISVNDVLKQGQQIDIHAVTKGKGFQGPVKRFGMGLKSHKSEKSRRQPGSLGGWTSQGHVMWRIPHAGQMGYHKRTEYNKLLIQIGNKPDEINPKGGFTSYGLIKNDYILVKGSIIGPKKRIIRLNHALRPNKKLSGDIAINEVLM
jgi:large subunit ribosomal protein L3